MYGSDILCGISKGTFEIPHKISYPYIERFHFHTKLKFPELLDLRAHKCFWNAPLVMHICLIELSGYCFKQWLADFWFQAVTETVADLLIIKSFETKFSKIIITIQNKFLQTCIWKCPLQNIYHIVWPHCCIHIMHNPQKAHWKVHNFMMMSPNISFQIILCHIKNLFTDRYWLN